MRLVDTSVWIEWLIDTAVGNAADALLPENEQWLVPTIVQFELAKWLTRELGERTAEKVIAFTRTCVIVELDSRMALWAADLSARHKLTTADALIYATALAKDADLLTCDRHFKGLAHVQFISKSDS
jgi:predicted nucleic acid-binding protein